MKKYFVTALGYDETHSITDYDHSYGVFDSYEEAYKKWVKVLDDEKSLFTNTDNLYQMCVFIEECFKNKKSVECYDLKNEYWVINPRFRSDDYEL